MHRMRQVHPAEWGAGIATATTSCVDFDTLLGLADQRLYAAKQSRHRPAARALP